MDVVVHHVKRFDVTLGLDDAHLAVLDGMVQQPVAHEIDQPVAGHSHVVLRKKLRMFLDERNEVVHPLLLRVETALAVLRDDELVATDAASLAVQTNIGGIAQAVALVQVVARVDKHVLNSQALQEVVVCQVSFSHGLTSPFSCRSPHGSSPLRKRVSPHPLACPRRA